MISTVCYFRTNYDLLKSVIFCSKVSYNGQWHQFQVFFFGCGLWEPFSPSTKNCWKREGTWDIFWWRHSCETLPPIKKKSVVGLSSSTKRTIYFGGINRSISVSDTWLNLARTVGLKVKCLLSHCQHYFSAIVIYVTGQTPLLKSPKSKYSCQNGG